MPGIVASTRDHYARTFLGECERGRAADASQRAGDENGFSGWIAHDRIS
jgi:hypothetical protein